VHRDLKPANVMVSNQGRVKVLDFGLATDVGASDPTDATLTSDHRTQAGIVMGTPAYMSPEQTSGRPLDHRTDIFSLGVVLHEMATGRRPFDGSSSAELVSAILRDTPQSVTEVRPDPPSDLARIVRRCLEKDPRHRLQTARDVSNEFRDLSRGTSQKVAPATTSAARVVAAADSGSARADGGFWVAVLPFKYAGTTAELKALADGLSEEIVTGLSRFSYLRVIARGSTAKYSSESGDIRAIGKELGARYVMEGGIRQAGTKLRLAVQLVDATTGAHLWAETYERGFNSEAAFELQDDLVPRIVSTVADMHGVLPRSMSAAVRFKASDQLTPYEALLRGFGHSVSFSPNDIVDVQSSLERALQQCSNNADCLAMLAIVQSDAYGFSDQFAADILKGALRAAQTAVEAKPTNALAYHALAKVLFFKRNIPAFRAAADRAVSLNPMDGATIAYMGILMAFAGDWEQGCQLTEKGMQLNANHPGWHLMTAWHDAYRRKDYPKALELALKLNAPKNPWVQRSLTVSYAQLGRNAEASSSLRDLLALVPNYAQVAREMHSRWLEPELVEHMMDGLRKAGLEIDGEARPAPSGATPMRTASGESRADEGFWVAVLPFKYSGGSAELRALAEGLSEDVITGLSRFSYLRVITRGSTAKYSSESGDIRAIG
jgi:TolB-like protein